MNLNVAVFSVVVFFSLTACDQLPFPESKTAAPNVPNEVATPEILPTLWNGALPNLTASLASAPSDGVLRIGGSLDSFTVSEDAASITLFGWALIKAEEVAPTLAVYAPDAIDVISITRVERPDVAQALRDEALRFSGFALTLAVEPDAILTEICIISADEVYGDHLVGIQPNLSLSCSVTTHDEQVAAP